ncbi:hypothetical protein NDU88_007378 [Pleurodeles waltl]|uniref:Uncharacterized protein n=1 Tax=Pleurodeles waltl TaxID=8319 RepID=A0AAV7VSB9_PLEWA|nr:hypothetical protein NDU88_007378 [Pleurodeles waltl]
MAWPSVTGRHFVRLRWAGAILLHFSCWDHLPGSGVAAAEARGVGDSPAGEVCAARLAWEALGPATSFLDWHRSGLEWRRSRGWRLLGSQSADADDLAWLAGPLWCSVPERSLEERLCVLWKGEGLRMQPWPCRDRLRRGAPVVGAPTHIFVGIFQGPPHDAPGGGPPAVACIGSACGQRRVVTVVATTRPEGA